MIEAEAQGILAPVGALSTESRQGGAYAHGFLYEGWVCVRHFAVGSAVRRSLLSFSFDRIGFSRCKTQGAFFLKVFSRVMRSGIPGRQDSQAAQGPVRAGFEKDLEMRFADLELARRLEEAEAVAGVRCAEAVARFHPECRAAVLKVGSGYAAFTGATSPITQAVGLGLRGPVTEAQIKRMEAFYRKRGAAVNIELCPLADAKLVQLLGRRGYHPIEFSNVLVRPVRRSERFPAPAAGVRVRRMEPGEQELWARMVAQGFAEHMKVTEELLSILEAFCSRPGSKCFFGLVDGKIAGGGVAVIRKRLAVLGGASTLPGVRRRGVQTALQHARLKFAARQGCDLAMTITQPGSTSQRNAERRGFHVVYTRCKLIRKWK